MTVSFEGVVILLPSLLGQRIFMLGEWMVEPAEVSCAATLDNGLSLVDLNGSCHSPVNHLWTRHDPTGSQNGVGVTLKDFFWGGGLLLFYVFNDLFMDKSKWSNRPVPIGQKDHLKYKKGWTRNNIKYLWNISCRPHCDNLRNRLILSVSISDSVLDQKLLRE
jgi:hypothetical protein